MDTSVEKDCNVIDSFFHQVINDMKNSLPIYEDFTIKGTRLHTALKTVSLCLSSFLESFQKVADMASGTKGSTRDIGSALTRLCLRHRSIENKIKLFNSYLMETLIGPLQDKLDDWRKTLLSLDKEHNRENKKLQQDVKRSISEAQKEHKKLKKGKPEQIEKIYSNANDKLLVLREYGLTCLKKLLIEERQRLSLLVTCLKPVMDEEVSMVSEATHLQEIVENLCLLIDNPDTLSNPAQQVISDLIGLSQSQQKSISLEEPLYAEATVKKNHSSQIASVVPNSPGSEDSVDSSGESSVVASTNSPTRHNVVYSRCVSQPLSSTSNLNNTQLQQYQAIHQQLEQKLQLKHNNSRDEKMSHFISSKLDDATVNHKLPVKGDQNYETLEAMKKIYKKVDIAEKYYSSSSYPHQHQKQFQNVVRNNEAITNSDDKNFSKSNKQSSDSNRHHQSISQSTTIASNNNNAIYGSQLLRPSKSKRDTSAYIIENNKLGEENMDRIYAMGGQMAYIERPHTISSAYEKMGQHQRIAISSQTYFAPERDSSPYAVPCLVSLKKRTISQMGDEKVADIYARPSLMQSKGGYRVPNIKPLPVATPTVPESGNTLPSFPLTGYVNMNQLAHMAKQQQSPEQKLESFNCDANSVIHKEFNKPQYRQDLVSDSNSRDYPAASNRRELEMREMRSGHYCQDFNYREPKIADIMTKSGERYANKDENKFSSLQGSSEQRNTNVPDTRMSNLDVHDIADRLSRCCNLNRENKTNSEQFKNFASLPRRGLVGQTYSPISLVNIPNHEFYQNDDNDYYQKISQDFFFQKYPHSYYQTPIQYTDFRDISNNINQTDSNRTTPTNLDCPSQASYHREEDYDKNINPMQQRHLDEAHVHSQHYLADANQQLDSEYI